MSALSHEEIKRRIQQMRPDEVEVETGYVQVRSGAGVLLGWAPVGGREVRVGMKGRFYLGTATHEHVAAGEAESIGPQFLELPVESFIVEGEAHLAFRCELPVRVLMRARGFVEAR